MKTIERLTTRDFSLELLRLYDDYAHSRIDRKGFLTRAEQFTEPGVSAESILESLSPIYGEATSHVTQDDPRIVSSYRTFPSPDGYQEGRGLFVQPAGLENAKGSAVLVVHENRGLNPYIEDVARRLAVAGYTAFAPDALYSLGGYPGTDDEGRALQQKLDRNKIIEDFVAAARFLQAQSNGSVGVIGFCFGGLVSNTLAWRLPEIIRAAVPYYGMQPPAADVHKIAGALLLHYAEHDERVNAGWPAYENALNVAQVHYSAYFYRGTHHGFHNDTTPRYDATAAKLSWDRTLAFFDSYLR